MTATATHPPAYGSPTLSKSDTIWLKFGSKKEYYFAGRDHFILKAGCHVDCVDVHTGEEQLLRANDAKTGDGVACITGHKSLSVMAFSEFNRSPRIFVLSVPSLKRISTLQSNAFNYLALAFSETELLIALRGYPCCSIDVWRWRTGELLTTAESGLIFTKQILKTNYGSPVYMAQMVKQTHHCLLWEIAMCGKKCLLKKEKVKYRDPENFNKLSTALWTLDGIFYVIDTIGHVYVKAPDNYLDVIISWENRQTGPYNTTFCQLQGGILLQESTGAMKHYKKEESGWKVQWIVNLKNPMNKIFCSIAKDIVIGVNKQDDLLKFDKETKTFNFLLTDDGKITHFSLIYPLCEFVVTLQNFEKLHLWDISTGELKAARIPENTALCLKSNPVYPYFGVGYHNGLLELFSCLDAQIKPMCSFLLCKNKITMLNFAEKGKIIVTCNSDTGEFFIIQGLPGGKFEILTTVNAHQQVADYMLVGARACLRLFAILVTSNRFIAGNCIHRFCIVRNCETTVKKYELENSQHLYGRIHAISDHSNRDRVFYAVPIHSKQLHVLETKRGDTRARIIERKNSDHIMKMIRWYFNDQYAISFSYGGLILIRSINWHQVDSIIMPHHRQRSGCRHAEMDVLGNYTVSLGREGLLVCTKLHLPASFKPRNDYVTSLMLDCEYMFNNESIGFKPTGIYAGLSWIEYRKLLETEAERKKFQIQRQELMTELETLKDKLAKLLTKNMEGPENELLDLQEFNLNLVLKEEKIKTSKESCEYTKLYLENMIHEYDRIANSIKTMYWDSIRVPRRSLWGIYANFDVQNYAITPPDPALDEYINRMQAFRIMEQMLSKNDIFAPWGVMSDGELLHLMQVGPKIAIEGDQIVTEILEETMEMEEMTDEQVKQLQQKREDEAEAYSANMGTTVQNFVTPVEGGYEQSHLQTFAQRQWDMHISNQNQYKLHEYFNKEFENISQFKIREMGQIIEKNAKLRYILSEINYFSKNQVFVDIVDPEWKQAEQPELITQVDNSEVAISPYISPSEQAVLDANAAEAERIRLALLADDFRERALMVMMNGVLEIRWEDELKKDVPVPKCMEEKQPEEFNEEDLRNIHDYEEKVAFLQAERERYKTILKSDYQKVSNQLKEGVKKFNERLQELLLLKIQVEAACSEEMLRINRMMQLDINRSIWDEKEDLVIKQMNELEAITEEVHDTILCMPEYITEIRTNIDQLQQKEKILDKNFKKEFLDASTTQIEVLSKLYKKRPKANIRNITSTCILMEIAKCLTGHARSLILNSDALDFLRALDQLDKFVGLPAMIDERMFTTLCRLRSHRIECEIKLRATQLELTESESTSAIYQKSEANLKQEMLLLKNKLEDIRYKKLRVSLNIELQAVLKEGYVECKRTGDLDDYSEAVCVSKKTIEDINAVIIDAGREKIKAMRNAMAFKRHIMMMEWEHRKNKMIIEDLQNYMADIDSVLLTKETQTFLKARARGESADKTMAFDHEVETIRERYRTTIYDRRNKVDELDRRIQFIKAENARLDKEITDLNLDVNELQLNKDELLCAREERLLKMKLTSHLKRSKLVGQIQANHNEILILQAQLELLRLRTFPILEYKVDL